MPALWYQLLQHHRIGRCSVGDDLDRCHLCGADGLFEEPTGCPRVPLGGDKHVDDLAELVDGPVDVPPPTGDLHVGLVDPPAGTDRVSARTCSVSQQRRKQQHPPVDGDVVDLHAALGKQLFDIAIGQAEAQVPAHRQHDDVGWEAEAGEGRAGDGSGAGLGKVPGCLVWAAVRGSLE